jgi:hypothetical protein
LSQRDRPAFYAARTGTAWRDWWTLLHPPYTAWHLSYVVIGASLVGGARLAPLVGSLVAFFLAVGIGAHALDELHGRPLGTGIPAPALVAASGISLAGALAIGVVGILRQGPILVPFIVVGAFFVLAYNLELFGGVFHNDTTFALGWGSFPLLTSYVAEAHGLGPSAVLGGLGAFFLSKAQRSLSTRARFVRRRVVEVTGTVVSSGGEAIALDESYLLAPMEKALISLSWGVVALAAAMAVKAFS